MQAFQLPFRPALQEYKMRHADGVVLCGSCFTAHIGARMHDAGMDALINPHGVLFNPMSIASAVRSWLTGKRYATQDIFLLHETWNSWDFHSQHAHTDPAAALTSMNTAVTRAGEALAKAKWLLITFGSAYQYFTGRHTRDGSLTGVANCHKAPGSWFEKRLLSVDDMQAEWLALAAELNAFNPALRTVVTVSPVKHIRDGLVENSRSKARLLELAHALTGNLPGWTYFPAYELVTDVLRDYRFYEEDMVHPNHTAAQYVWQQFVEAYMEEQDRDIMDRVAAVKRAMQHRPRFPDTEGWRQFCRTQLKKVRQLQQEAPYLDLSGEIACFEK